MELISPAEFAKEKLEAVQDFSVLAGRSVANLFRYPRYFADMMQQADLIGVGSLPIVVLTGLSIGAEFTSPRDTRKVSMRDMIPNCETSVSASIRQSRTCRAAKTCAVPSVKRL